MSKKKGKKRKPVEITPEEYARRLARGGAAILDVLARVEARSSDPQMAESVKVARAVVASEMINAAVAATGEP